jgi:hypothetical protein
VLKHFRSRINRDERGQMLMIGALLIPVLLGMAAIAVDLGDYASHRRTLQNAADSMALAAAQDLPDGTAATASADAWAAKNNIPAGSYTVTITPQGAGNPNPKVTVFITRPHKFGIMQVLGVSEKDVHGRAAAIKTSSGGGAGVVPWSITQDTADSAPYGSPVVIKYDASSTDYGQGNFGVIRVDGNGSSDYEDAASYGADSVICAETTPGCDYATCPGSYPDTCSENAPECDGEECPPKTGNMTGGTRDAVDFRIDYTSAACDTFEEVFPTQSDGLYQIDPDCNPWSGGSCATDTSICSRRVFLIPVVDSFGNGSSDPTTIVRFALVFLEGYGSGNCTGNSCEITARFVRAELTTNSLTGVFDPDDSNSFVRLSE